MTTTGQDYDLYRGQDAVITVTLTSVTFTGTEQLAAYFRNRASDSLEVTKTTGAGVAISANGPPATVTVTLTDTDTELLTRGLCDWSFWRTDADSETPYSVGTVTVRGSSRQR